MSFFFFFSNRSCCIIHNREKKERGKWSREPPVNLHIFTLLYFLDEEDPLVWHHYPSLKWSSSLPHPPAVVLLELGTLPSVHVCLVVCIEAYLWQFFTTISSSLLLLSCSSSLVYINPNSRELEESGLSPSEKRQRHRRGKEAIRIFH